MLHRYEYYRYKRPLRAILSHFFVDVVICAEV